MLKARKNIGGNVLGIAGGSYNNYWVPRQFPVMSKLMYALLKGTADRWL
jgi:hypothetical protein